MEEFIDVLQLFVVDLLVVKVTFENLNLRLVFLEKDVLRPLRRLELGDF